jgi:hypothetical protein
VHYFSDAIKFINSILQENTALSRIVAVVMICNIGGLYKQEFSHFVSDLHIIDLKKNMDFYV